MKAQQRIKPVMSEGPLSNEEQWKYLYQARTFEVTRLNRALTKRARTIRGLKLRIERLEKKRGK